MKRKVFVIILIFIILILGIEIIIQSSDIVDIVRSSWIIWERNIFPTLFPFFVISNILINLGFPSFLGELLKPFMYSVFKIKGAASFVLVLSMLSGFPSSSKYTKELYLNGEINDEEATKLLTFTHFSNPLFIFGTIAVTFLNNKDIGLLILICHYLGNLIVGLIFRNYYVSQNQKEKVSIKKAFEYLYQKKTLIKKNFGQILNEALISSINTLLLILGVITIFLIISTIINNHINLNPYNHSILSGILEITQGLKYSSALAIPLLNKALLATMFISFGGLSVHMQTISIISDTKIKYLPFLIARIIHASVSSILLYILFNFYFSL